MAPPTRPDTSPSADAMLAEMAEGGRGVAPKVRPQVAKIRYTHADCIDRIIANPGISQNELAMIYGMTAGWMSIIINSDAFKVRLAERKEELIDPVLAATLNERFAAVAARSAEVLLEKLSRPADEVSDKLALEAASLGARVMGMGEAKPSVGPNATDHLAAIAHRLMDLNNPPPKAVIDV